MNSQEIMNLVFGCTTLNIYYINFHRTLSTINFMSLSSRNNWSSFSSFHNVTMYFQRTICINQKPTKDKFAHTLILETFPKNSICKIPIFIYSQQTQMKCERSNISTFLSVIIHIPKKASTLFFVAVLFLFRF